MEILHTVQIWLSPSSSKYLPFLVGVRSCIQIFLPESPHIELSDLSNLLLFLGEGYVLQTSAVYFWPEGSTVGLASIKGLKHCSQLLSLTPKTSQSCLISVSSVQICKEEEITSPWVSCYGMWPSRSPLTSLAQGSAPMPGYRSHWRCTRADYAPVLC